MWLHTKYPLFKNMFQAARPSGCEHHYNKIGLGIPPRINSKSSLWRDGKWTPALALLTPFGADCEASNGAKDLVSREYPVRLIIQAFVL